MNKKNKSKNPVHTFHQVPQNNVPAQSPCRFVLNIQFRWPLAADRLNPFLLLLHCESCRHERAKSAQPTRKKTSLSAEKTTKSWSFWQTCSIVYMQKQMAQNSYALSQGAQDHKHAAKPVQFRENHRLNFMFFTHKFLSHIFTTWVIQQSKTHVLVWSYIYIYTRQKNTWKFCFPLPEQKHVICFENKVETFWNSLILGK